VTKYAGNSHGSNSVVPLAVHPDVGVVLRVQLLSRTPAADSLCMSLDAVVSGA